MPVRIEPFTPEHVPAVRAFNRRLSQGGVGWRFPENPMPEWLPPDPGTPVFQQYFVLQDADQVRGAYILRQREAWIRGESRRVGTLELPLSEGTVDRAYSMVGYQLLRDALRRQPLLFGVGIGGDDLQIARLVGAMGWRRRRVPFLFKVRNGTRFCQQLRYLRGTALRGMFFDLAARSGVGWAGARTADLLLTRKPPVCAEVDQVDSFEEWADELWRGCRGAYSFVGARDRDALNRIYSTANRHLTRLRVAARSRLLGYAIVEDRQMAGNEYFGDLRVGTLMDGLARPDEAAAVAWHATRFLEDRGVDLLVSNQSHPAWVGALRSAGFLPGPSNFLLVTAPALTELIDVADPDGRALHLTRGEGPAPWGVGFRVGLAGNGGAPIPAPPLLAGGPPRAERVGL